MKNIKIIALLVMTLVVVLACFTSCETLQQIPGINQIPGIKPEEPVHEHSYENGKCECGELEPGYSCLNHTWGEEITLGAEPTCTEDGYNLVTCTVCGYQRKTPIFRLGHNYTDEQTFVIAGTCEKKGSITKICTRCSESDITETPMHPNTDIAYGYAPTCLDDGMYTRMECPDCGKMWGDQACTQEVTLEQVTIPATGHQSIVHNEAAEAGCHQNGNIEHWICMDCGFAWLDEACTLNTNVKSVILPHTAEIVDVDAVEPGCHQDGNVAYSYCSECFYAWTVDEEGNKMTTTFKDVVILHTAEIVNVAAVEANCHQNGNVAYSYCAECEYAWTVDEQGNKMTTTFKDVVILHTAEIVDVAAAEPGCHQDGNVAYSYCPECFYAWTVDEEGNKMTTTFKDVVILHTAEIVDVAAVDKTCFENGNIAYSYCAECSYAWTVDEEGNKMTTNAQSVVVPMSHNTLTHVEAKPNCLTEGNIEYWWCEACGYAWLDAEGILSTNLQSVKLAAVGSHTNENGDFQCDVCSAYLLPAEGVAFKLSLVQANLGKTLYFTGEMSGYYFATSENYFDGVDVYVENAEGGFNLYFMNGETKNYLYVVASGTYINVKYGTTNGGNVWTLNEKYGTLVTLVDGVEYYIGTYNTFNTISASKTSFVTDSSVDATQFVARPTTVHEHDLSSVVTAPSCTREGYTTYTCSICNGSYVADETEKVDHVYVDGKCSTCGASENPEEKVEVTVSKTGAELSTLAGSTIDGAEIALDNNITAIFAKGSAGTAPAYYDPAIRLYQNGATLTVKGSGMKTIIITCNGTAGKGPISVVGGTASALTDDKYTITVDAGVSEVVVTTTGTDKNSRVYVANLEVVYEH